MKQYRGYHIINSEDKVVGTVWWDGERIRASSPETLRKIKKTFNPIGFNLNLQGEAFFNTLPMAFRNGMTYLKKVTVDDKGNEV